ncbi:hypothetical protein [Magnetospira sp. QH-2]|uniref:hypothetical protein n=1 Tax=Magnetospira sp. (strain QH-2) TaxID=1288970 RepID=UPI0003E8170B|nr:hypothetical protein [Magnetospira sp. QH-2]CCQ73516.1 Exported protein of unknown function [Magnetospira sp. QH-2]
MHIRRPTLAVGTLVATSLTAVACGPINLPIPITIYGQESLTLEHSYAAPPKQVAICMMQELNTVWPVADHKPEIVERDKHYRITTTYKSLLRGVLKPDAIIDITDDAGNRGTRASVITANQRAGAHRSLEIVVKASNRCQLRFGGEAPPLDAPGSAQWPGYSFPDQ